MKTAGTKARMFYRCSGKLQSTTFTLIELLVTAVQQNCLSKIKNDTSLRPQGRTSRIFDKSQKCSSHLHIFTQSAFTLIELLVVTSQLCRDFLNALFIRISTDVYGNIRRMPLTKIRRIILAKQVLHVCRRQTLHAATLRFTRQSRASFDQRSR